MQWEVCILNAVPAPPLPNKESRLSPAMFSSRSASHTQLWRAVWEQCSHPACVLGKKARRLARCHSRSQQISKSSGNPSPLQLEGGEIGKRETKAYFKVPKGRGGGHLWAELRLVTNPLPLNISRTLTWVPLLPHDKSPQYYTDASQHHAMVSQSTLTTEYSFKGAENNWFLIQRRYGCIWEKEGNNLTLLTLCRMQHHQEALLWASLHKDKATPYKAVTLSTLHI